MLEVERSHIIRFSLSRFPSSPVPKWRKLKCSPPLKQLLIYTRINRDPHGSNTATEQQRAPLSSCFIVSTPRPLFSVLCSLSSTCARVSLPPFSLSRKVSSFFSSERRLYTFPPFSSIDRSRNFDEDDDFETMDISKP